MNRTGEQRGRFHALNDGGGSGGTGAPQLAGTGTLTKIGPGTLSLGQSNGANYDFSGFTGQLLINAGISPRTAVAARSARPPPGPWWPRAPRSP